MPFRKPHWPRQMVFVVCRSQRKPRTSSQQRRSRRRNVRLCDQHGLIGKTLEVCCDNASALASNKHNFAAEILCVPGLGNVPRVSCSQKTVEESKRSRVVIERHNAQW